MMVSRRAYACFCTVNQGGTANQVIRPWQSF
nr:MAG TPA: hypothetical protein [Caudoviricetes sp.]